MPYLEANYKVAVSYFDHSVPKQPFLYLHTPQSPPTYYPERRLS